PGTTHPDSLSVALLLHPELIQSAAQYLVQVETESALTRGYTAMSWAELGAGSNARVIERVAAAAFFDLIRSTLAIPTTPQRPIRDQGSQVAL
ncbi:MAG: nucleoside hydrolase, partial [Candidatus Limnocylindrales bacterium]